MDCLREARPDRHDLIPPTTHRNQGFVVRLLKLTRTFKQGGGSGTERTKAFWQFGQTINPYIQLCIDAICCPFHGLQPIQQGIQNLTGGLCRRARGGVINQGLANLTHHGTLSGKTFAHFGSPGLKRLCCVCHFGLNPGGLFNNLRRLSQR
jgi:hypothetical protein